MRLSDGDAFPAETLVWTTGVRPAPVISRTGLPVDANGRVTCDAYLRVVDGDGDPIPGAWAAGDAASVPDPATGRPSPPTAQHALRQGRCLADNLVATIEGQPLTPLRLPQPRPARLARPLPGRRPAPRPLPPPRLPRLVAAPHLPPGDDADVQSAGPHRARLDRRPPLSPRHHRPGLAPTPARPVHAPPRERGQLTTEPVELRIGRWELRVERPHRLDQHRRHRDVAHPLVVGGHDVPRRPLGRRLGDRPLVGRLVVVPAARTVEVALSGTSTASRGRRAAPGAARAAPPARYGGRP